MPLVRIRDVKEGSTETYYKGDFPKEYIIHRGDFLVGMDGEFNIAAWRSEDALLNQRVCRVVSKNQEVLTTFLYRFLKKELKKIEDETPFVTVKHLSAKRLGQVYLDVPSLSEQERIVAELDLLQGIIDKQKAQLKELDTLAQSIFYDMFEHRNDPTCRIVEICENADDIKCGPFGTQLSKTEYQNEGIAIWGIPQVNSLFRIPPTEFITEEKAHALEAFSVIAGDIVMSRKGNVGQCAVFPSTFNPGIIHSDVLRIRPDRLRMNPLFLMHQLHLSDTIKRQIINVSSGAIMPGINVGKLKQIHVFTPPISLQQSFATKIEAIEIQKTLINQSIAETQKLFDYTMDKYFG